MRVLTDGPTDLKVFEVGKSASELSLRSLSRELKLSKVIMVYTYKKSRVTSFISTRTANRHRWARRAF